MSTNLPTAEEISEALQKFVNDRDAIYKRHRKLAGESTRLPASLRNPYIMEFFNTAARLSFISLNDILFNAHLASEKEEFVSVANIYLKKEEKKDDEIYRLSVFDENKNPTGYVVAYSEEEVSEYTRLETFIVEFKKQHVMYSRLERFQVREKDQSRAYTDGNTDLKKAIPFFDFFRSLVNVSHPRIERLINVGSTETAKYAITLDHGIMGQQTLKIADDMKKYIQKTR